MFFAPPLAYDQIMRRVPRGKLITVGSIREYLARANQADFTDPITAGLFISIAAWASHQRSEDKIPYWRTLKAGGELNPKYPGGIQAQREKLEAEGHTILARGQYPAPVLCKKLCCRPVSAGGGRRQVKFSYLVFRELLAV